MTITWQALLFFCSALITVATAIGILLKTKKQIMKSIEGFVCMSTEKMVEPLMQAQVALLRHQIVRDHEYYMRQKQISLHAMQSVEELYLAYHNMHGNGFVDRIMLDLRKLPLDATYVREPE